MYVAEAVCHNRCPASSYKERLYAAVAGQGETPVHRRQPEPDRSDAGAGRRGSPPCDRSDRRSGGRGDASVDAVRIRARQCGCGFGPPPRVAVASDIRGGVVATAAPGEAVIVIWRTA